MEVQHKKAVVDGAKDGVIAASEHRIKFRKQTDMDKTQTERMATETRFCSTSVRH